MAWRSEVDPGEFYRIRVTSNRLLTDTEAERLFGIVGYAFRQHFRGEPLGKPERVGPNRWTAWYDITKSASDDWLWRLPDALGAARRYAIEGTPVYRTNRVGRAGTRLIDGFGPINLVFEFD